MMSNSVVRSGSAGLAAGLLATYVMDGAAEALYGLTSDEDKAKERAAQSESALSLAAERILVAIGRDAPDEALVGQVGNALHWAFGTSSGALYGLLDATIPKFHRTLGAPLIVALIAFDEFGLAALGLAQTPERYPAATHVRSIFGHLVYGAVLAVGYRGLIHLAD
jgi:hypothetical protein